MKADIPDSISASVPTTPVGGSGPERARHYGNPHQMLSVTEKVRENRLRRALDRQGYRLTRVRRQDHRARDYGQYTILAEDGTPSTASLLLSGLRLASVEAT